MSALAQRAEQYLRLRRALGHQLDDAHRLLPRFVAFLDRSAPRGSPSRPLWSGCDVPTLTRASSVWSRRMTVVRGFARHMSGIDPDTEIPPLGLVAFQRHWRPPFIYSSDDVETLMAAVTRLVPTPLRAATFQTMIGLLAATGMRVGETIALDRNDIDWAEAVIVVRSSKFTSPGSCPWTRPRSTRWRATPRSGIDACPARRARRSSSPARAHRSSTPTSEPSSAHSWPRPGSGLTRRPSPAFTTYATASRCTPWSVGIKPARTSRPCCPGCRPTSAISPRATPTGTSLPPPSCWRSRPAACKTQTGDERR